MSGGKAVPVGPTARLSGTSWEHLDKMTPEQIKEKGLFPHPPLPFPDHAEGGMLFPKMTIDVLPRLTRFDLDFDLPEHVLPEKAPPIFLTTRPDLGDVSRGRVITLENYFPPAPKLDIYGELDAAKATPSEVRGQALFVGKARCSACHPAPNYTDNNMHNLKAERFYKQILAGGMMMAHDGPIKTFPLRGIKDSPPYLHDGRCLTLEDTVEYFNLVQQLHLTAPEKKDLVAFLRTL